MDPFRYYRHLRHAKRFVDAHLTEPIGLVDVSHAVGLSPAYFSTLFHKTTGVRFSDWLGHRRITVAKQLLCKDDRPVYQIAIDLGFGSVSTFERMFKKYEHVSPTVYRKINQNASWLNLKKKS